MKNNYNFNDDLLKFVHMNVYLTNFLMLPSIIFIILIIKNITSWKENTKTMKLCKFYYQIVWFLILIIYVLALIFSSLCHLLEYNEIYPYYTPIRELSFYIDTQISAPLLVIIVTILFIFYFVYINHISLIKNETKKKTLPVFITGMLYSLCGVIIYAYKHYKYPEWDTDDYIICRYSGLHTLFHYMSYSGAILLFALYYLENKSIFKALFEEYDT